MLSCSTNNTGEETKEVKDLPAKQWILDSGFVHPESVISFEEGLCYFVSNIGTDESNDSPNGFISKVALNGEIIELKWVDSIQSPKGQCVVNNHYYVSALDELLEISIASGAIINRYTAPEVIFLNDVTADDAGNIYVSGMRENAIYKLDTIGNFFQWFQNDNLHHPNGLLAVDNHLYVGGWGNMDENEANIDSVGHFMSIDLESQKLTYITDDKPGKLDGIQLADETKTNFIVSSWKAGKIFNINLEGKVEELISTPITVGDIYFDRADSTLIFPLNFQHRVECMDLLF